VLRNKKILLGVSGSIAAYKSAILIRLLVKSEAEVQVVMTPSASDFISPLTLSTLSKKPAFTEFVKDGSGQWNNHVELGLWADLIIVAPASANTIAKMANGICDNLLSAVYLSARCPVAIAPSMDLDMYDHPAVRNNLEKLRSFGNHVMDAPFGALASGLSGHGRMAEPENIIQYIKEILNPSVKLKNKKVLVTAGPTYEPLDPVRFIGNYSSGKMGYELAAEFSRLGAEVTLISGPSGLPRPSSVNFIPVTTASEMYEKALFYFADTDIAVLSAAVADYTPKDKSPFKIKKKEDAFNLELIKTADIAAQLGKNKKKDQFLVGFALETDHEIENALQKMASKNLDMIVLNSLNDKGAGFGHDTNKVTILKKDQSAIPFPLQSKKEAAGNIIQTIVKCLEE
jgi:phosphopantothenoylcysteine decarboxylase / phosphopantothenate---cysteine ligase